MGSERNHPFLKRCMYFYKGHPFVQEDGSFYTTFIAPDIFAYCARDFGFKYIDCLQHLEHGMTIYDSTIFAGALSELHSNNFAIHTCSGSRSNQSFFQRLRTLRYQLHRINNLSKIDK